MVRVGVELSISLIDREGANCLIGRELTDSDTWTGLGLGLGLGLYGQG